jgi:muramoyltetrapeptide carboxypeptidase
MQKLPFLNPGDSVEVIAPASRCSDTQLTEIKQLLLSWQLNCIIQENIFGNDLLCANTDEVRFQLLKNALLHPTTKAVICARGGYGSMRLLPALTQITPPATAKLLVGMSDITALNLYLQQQWQWPVLHGGLAPDKFSAASIAALKAILLGETNQVELNGLPLNTLAQKNQMIESTVLGGNLCLVQASIGTVWQINGAHKIIFLEDIGERGYRIDRMLEHLRQAGIFNEAAAILFGDFMAGKEPNGTCLIQPVLARFAEQCTIPVVQITGLGHGQTNFPLPLGTKTKLYLGNEIKLISALPVS